MTTAHEEFEVGHELDRSLRAVVTGLAQMMERRARLAQDRSRDEAARAREDWLAHRDAARQKFVPWTVEGRIEKLDWYDASQKWAAAAAWADLDPMARMAEQDLADRIVATHGQHPSILIHGTDPKTQPVDPVPATKLLTMNEAYGLASTHAPAWYAIPDGVGPLEHDRPPATVLEEAFHADWQYYSEAGVLPERSQHEQWATHVGRGEEFTPDKWQNVAGGVDHEARDAALEAVWAEGRAQRSAEDLQAHGEAMTRAGMIEQIAGPQVEDKAWNAYLTPQRFDAARPEDLARAWRDANVAALTGDTEARQAAEKLASMMRERRGVNPESLLLGALADHAAVATEARRAAEDRATRLGEAARPSARPVVEATTEATSETITRARVVELNNMAADFYASNLQPGTQAHAYFTDRLGPEWSDKWQLGATRSGWTHLSDHLRGRGATDAELVAAGLAEPGRYGVRDVFRDRAMIGVRDSAGDLVGFVGRALAGDPRAPKVRNTGETPAFRKGDHVFGLYEARDDAKIVRVEGPFDAMAVSLASDGDAAGVAPLGTQMTETQASLIAEWAGDRVWLANDSDDAGKAATEADFYAFSGKGLDVRQMEVPGSDPAEAWQARPALMRASAAALDAAPSAAETVVDRYVASPDATREGFSALMGRLSSHMPDQMERDLLAQRVAELDRAQAVRREAETNEARLERRSPYVGDGADGARRSADIDRTEIDTLPTGPHAPEWSERTEARRHELEDSAARWEAQAEDLERAEAITDEAERAEDLAYDRRDEATREQMSRPAEAARDDSSHGFSQSTEEQVQAAPTRKATQAKVQRGRPAQQIRGRSLRR